MRVRAALHPGSLLGALAVLSLLAAFAGVVRKAVAEAEASRRASALLVEARWRCQALKPPRQREDCLRIVHEARPADSATLQALVSAAAAPALAVPAR